MKHVKLFEEYTFQYLSEGMMSEIDIIGQEAKTKTEFKAEVIRFLKHNAKNPSVADNDDFIEELTKAYFDEDGNKLSESKVNEDEYICKGCGDKAEPEKIIDNPAYVCPGCGKSDWEHRN